jgi:hypothetical protein
VNAVPGGDETLVQDFFAEEARRQRLTVLRLVMFVVLLDIVVLLAFRQGVPWRMLVAALAVALVAVAVVAWRTVRARRALEQRLMSLLGAIEMDWDRLGEMNLSEDEMEWLHHAFSQQFSGAKRVNTEHRRQRGMDEKGPAFDKRGQAFAKGTARVDPGENEAAYSGLEGPLLKGETLLEEANASYTEHAQRRWEEAEKNDPDMIEAGVERLGDLVASGWFEANQKDGAVAELLKTAETEEMNEHLL